MRVIHSEFIRLPSRRTEPCVIHDGYLTHRASENQFALCRNYNRSARLNERAKENYANFALADSSYGDI